MKKIIPFAAVLFCMACNNHKETADETINKLAKQYVKLGLTIGLYDADFVDAYYGPDSLKPLQAKAATFPKDSLLTAVNNLKSELDKLASEAKSDTIKHRAIWINQQLTAFGRRIKIFSGAYGTFDEESKELYGVTAPTYTESYFQTLVEAFNNVLPGKGNANERFQQLTNRFIIPKDKLDTVFKVAIAEARKRTLQHYDLPASEKFVLEYVTNKPWSGYNWYKGNYTSTIQINTDLPIFIDKALDVGSHESYPGHHVYNLLLEKKLYRDKGWVEISLYPLYSPQSLIAEGSGNFGIEVAFPGTEKNTFVKQVLLPLAGIDTAGIDLYFKAMSLRGKLGFARNEVARGLINGTMTEKEAIRWLKEYGFANEETAVKYISFIHKNRSYVINYNYGQQLVKEYVEALGGTEDASARRWEVFGNLLSNEFTTEELLNVKKQ